MSAERKKNQSGMKEQRVMDKMDCFSWGDKGSQLNR